MAFNRHLLHDSLLKFQRTVFVDIDSPFKVLRVTNNNDPYYPFNASNVIQPSSNSSSEEEDELQNNPYYSAYADKLAEFKKKNTNGYYEALQRFRTKNQNTNNDIDSTPATITEATSDQIDSASNKMQPKAKRRPSQTLLVKPKTLDQIMNMDLLLNKPWRDITEIWLAYHKKRDDTLSAVIPLKHFNIFYDQSIKYPMFILPLPRNNGYEFIFIQFQHFQENTVFNCSVHFTPLISYQTHNENAPECMTVEYYTDLCDGDKVNNVGSIDEPCVLMRAMYDGKLLSAAEASCLVNQLRIFYQPESGVAAKERLLKLFNKGDEEFEHSDLIGCLETLSL